MSKNKRSVKTSFLNKLHLKLTSLLRHSHCSKKTLIDASFLVASVCALVLVSARLPEMHDSYIRSKVGSRVYKVQAELTGGGGTGFQLKAPSGTDYVITNSHVCDHVNLNNAPENKGTALIVDDEGHSMRRRIVSISNQSDLCLIEGMPGVGGLSVGDVPDVGTHATVVGHPHLRPTTLSSGEIVGYMDVEIFDHVMAVKDNPFLETMLPPIDPNAKCDMPKNEIKSVPVAPEFGGGEVQVCLVVTKNAYMTSIVIYPGNSGSPLVDWYGRVIGVVFAGDSSDNYGEMVSLSDLKDFIARY